MSLIQSNTVIQYTEYPQYTEYTVPTVPSQGIEPSDEPKSLNFNDSGLIKHLERGDSCRPTAGTSGVELKVC